MFDWLRRLRAYLAPRPTRQRPVPRRIRARYDAAQSNDDNERHWANADGLSSAAANDPGTRRTLRNRSRYESDNNGYCGGIIRTLANDLVGTGPTLQVLTDDEGLNERIETTFAGWCRAVRFAEKLWTFAAAKARDGEAFIVLSTNPGVAHPVQLDLRLVEADQVDDPNGINWPQAGSQGGIEYDAYGNPVWYTVLREHPGDTLRTFPMASDRIAARYVIHWFRRDRPGQLRGIPELMPSLPIFAQLRRWTLATLTAAETAASFAATLETEMPPDGETDDPTPFETLEIERGMMTTLPAGSKLNQLDPSQPTTTYPDFKREIIAEAGRPVHMPVNIVAGDSSKHNFSSAKLDHFNYRGSLRVDRSFAELNVLEPILRAWWDEARLIPDLLPAGVELATLPRSWYWPGWPAMDKDEAKNDTERLANHTATLAEILAEWGQDWKQVLRQRGREIALAKEVGAIAEPAAPAAPTSGQADTDTTDDMEARVRVDIEAFDPNQPRDDRGRFGSGGGSDAKDAERDREDSERSAQRDKEDAEIAQARDKEDADVETAREREDAADEAAAAKLDADDERISDERDAEDERISDTRDAEDEAAEKADDKEDAAVEKARDKEDAEVEKARAKEDAEAEKETAKIEKERDREDAETEKARDKEDAAVSKARDKEDAELDKRQAREAAALDRDLDERDASDDDREKATDELDKRHDAERDEITTRRDAEDAARDIAREKADDERHSRRSDEDTAREKAAEDRQAQREREDEERQARRDREDEERESARETRNAEREAARAKEDAERSEKRAEEDEKRQAARAALEAKREAKDAQREREDEERQARRDREDDARDAARADEDDAIDRRRSDEDSKDDEDAVSARLRRGNLNGRAHV